ncbi:Involved in acetate metabolism (By similarity) [Seminavis robusta]|uniref:Involved in acetate metabolism By similarity n=1 Tax=Seminavis robusta TaxID=568900 RepID=A0A9N8EPT9_9STRA|nr:Involved in acetate metabolism (By similarity) [Seminavis robusta]|eukprot:Sro1553_g281960.1 Involved in acetate metabolism (By similarity) (427) ;mRNA; r:21505-22882
MKNLRIVSSSLRPRQAYRRPFSSVAAAVEDPPNKSPIYVAATRQHVGKTTTSLAIMSGLQKRFDRVGFIKPVGQVCLTVQDEWGNDIDVDKDVVVVRNHFGLDHCPYQHMSPVRIPPGYTRDYVDGHITSSSQHEDILESFEVIDSVSDVTLCEGTGHCAVGSIVGASNARVASWIGGKMILVANGGLGSTFDELELNRVLCDYHNVEVAGVIVNKVQHDKYEQTQYYIEKALETNWGIPLLGCIPDRPFLGCPALVDLERLFEGSFLLATKECQKLKHYSVRDINLVATSLAVFLRNLRSNQDRTLYLCHSSRVDIMLGFLMEYQRTKALGKPWEAALVVCGREEYELPDNVMDMYLKCEAPPMLVCREGTKATMERIMAYTPKHNNEDTHRLEIAVNHYEPFIDFDLLLERTGNAIPAAKSASA